MSKYQTNIDKKELFKELQSAMNEDKRYWIRNDAKLRAVHTSKTYEEFCDIVSAAHLGPLEKKDALNRGKSYTWNSMVRNSKE